MLKISKEARIGIVSICTIVCVIWGYSFLKGKDIFKQTNDYVVVYNNAQGLIVGNPVILNGLKIGQVVSIALEPSKIDQIVIQFSIEKKYKLPKGTVADLISSDLMGSKAINIIWGDANQGYYSDGEVIPSSVSPGLIDQLKPLQEKIDNLIVQVDSLVYGARKVLSGNVAADIQNSVANIKDITATFAGQKEKINSIFNNINSLSIELVQSKKELSRAIHNFALFSDSLSSMQLKSAVAHADSLLNQANILMTAVNSGQGSLGKLVKNDTLYYRLESAAGNLDSLLFDLREHPKRYVHFSIFGRKKE
jgi:phospholipid/cholesterol/gamma-HCH transport system substrate-binding protein